MANGAETELIVSIYPADAAAAAAAATTPAPAPTAVLSHVQVRGSVPLPWAQTPNLQWQPPVTLDAASPGQQRGACARHLDRLGEEYGGAVAAVNLIDMCGKSAHSQAQAQLGMAFTEAVFSHQAAQEAAAERRRVTAKGGGGGGGIKGKGAVTYTWFDFHKECAQYQWGRLELLLDKIDADLAGQGWTVLMNGGGQRAVQQQQKGVVRTNCVDNLDRTNVVQSLVARRVLAKALGPSSVAAATAPALDGAFKALWVANADALSRCYAGTPALKTDFVLTGKRTLLKGPVSDGCYAVTRYYVNNFWDGARQDAVALWLGDFRPGGGGGGGGSSSGSRGKSPFGPYYHLSLVPGGLLFTVSKGVQELAPAQLTLQLGSFLVETAMGIARALLFLPDDALLLRLLLVGLMWLLLWAGLLECALTLGPFTTLKTLRRESWRLTDRPVLASLTGRPAPRPRNR